MRPDATTMAQMAAGTKQDAPAPAPSGIAKPEEGVSVEQMLKEYEKEGSCDEHYSGEKVRE